VIDPREELEVAWAAIHAAGGPQRVPEAWREFTWLPYEHHDAQMVKARLAADRITTVREWTVAAQAHYRAAARLAQEGR
jgi:hypothetical protein